MTRTIQQLFDLKDHVALVTARKADELEAAVAHLRAAGIDARWIAADCAKEADIHRLAAETLQLIQYLAKHHMIAKGKGSIINVASIAGLAALGEKRLAAHAPLGRLGDDEDLKGLTLLHASDAGKHITGQWMAVDGGVSVVIGG